MIFMIMHKNYTHGKRLEHPYMARHTRHNVTGELGDLPLVLVQALNADPTKRPGSDKIVREVF